MTGKPGVPAERLENTILTTLAKRHRIHPDDENAMGSFNSGRKFREISSIFVAINLLVWFVGICTLLAGVVGVSNIMLIIVKERTKEIGIRKAVGATPWSITSQILQESTALTAIAGYLGLAIGVFLLHVFSLLIGDGNDTIRDPQVNFRIAMIATAVLVVSGAIAGLIPAYNAVRTNTVEALRAE
jgi:putative ABC transport system permease protein